LEPVAAHQQTGNKLVWEQQATLYFCVVNGINRIRHASGEQEISTRNKKSYI